MIKVGPRTFLVAQGIKVCLLMQRTQVRSLSREDFTYHEASETAPQLLKAARSGALEPQLTRLCATIADSHTQESVLPSEGNHGDEKPVHRS